MPAGKKSRSGCARCKEKRLRCDEAKPACNRCLRAHEICPGYQRALKWSSKHEVRSFPSSSSAERHVQDAACADLERTIDLTAQPQFELQDIDNEELFGYPPLPDLLVELVESQDGLHGSPIQLENHQNQFFTFSDGSYMPPEVLWDSMAVYTDDKSETGTSVPMTQHLQPPTPLYPGLISTEHALVEYYFKEVASIYSCYDGNMNPFRTTMARLWSSSAEIAKTLQSMAAACLSPSYPHLASQGYRLRQEVYENIATRPSSGVMAGTSLLVTIMLGQTAGWHDPRDLGLKYYRRAKELLRHLEADTGVLRDSALGKDITFFQNAVGYWETLLSFIMSKEQTYPLTKLSVVTQPTDSQIEPHPWTLAASDLLDVIREVGQLVWANRNKQLKTEFWRTSDLLDFVSTVGEARELERRLLYVKLASKNSLIDPNDETTPVAHLLAISQAYRLTALIMIYRCFPDVLVTRMQSTDVDALLGYNPSTSFNTTPDANKESDRDWWLKRLALHTVRLIKTIPIQSHTRCIQPFLLVALSCETGSLQGSSVSDIVNEDTFEAREFIQGRLEAFRHYLPPKPAQVRVDLVIEIWRCLDSGKAKSFWIDVVIEKEWQYLFG